MATSEADMTSRLHEDEVLTALLVALEDLHNIRNEMHSSIKQGFLNMAKARRSLGRNSVSVLDTRGQHSAEVKIDINPSSQARTGPEACTIFIRSGALDATESGVAGSLRQRGGAASHHLEDEEVSLQAESDATLRNDSLNLFAGLAPPPLRRSKKNFTSAVDYAIEVSNLAHHISRLLQEMELCRGKSSDHSG